MMRTTVPAIIAAAALVTTPAAAFEGGAVPAEGEVDRLVKRLQEPGDASRRAAARRVGELGARARLAVPALVALVGAEDAELRRDVVFALARIGRDAGEAAEAVTERLAKDADARVRAHAAWFLESAGAGGKKEAAALQRALKDEDGPVVANAARAAGVLGLTDRATVSALGAALSHADWTARVNAAWGLGRLGGEAKPATMALVKALGDDVETVRLAAAGALALVRGEDRKAVPALLKALDAAIVEKPATEGEAKPPPAAAGDGKDAASGPEDAPLRRLLVEHGGARRNMCWALGRYGTQDREGARVLGRARDADANEIVRAAAETALARRDSRAFPAALEEKDRAFPPTPGSPWTASIHGGILIVFRYEF